jgi:rhomboid protease GluP
MDEGPLSPPESAAPPPARRPRSPVTYTILAINLVVFAGMLAEGVSPFMPDAESLLRWGADYAPATTSGEWWRLLTAAFVHVGVVHLIVNLWALRAVGPLVERLYGGAAFTAIYATAALTGNLSSLMRGEEGGVSAGASGALFGVLGALGAFLFTHRGFIEPHALKSLRSNVVSVIALNLAAGFFIPFIDNRAHLGGLAGGALAGLAAGSFRAPSRTAAPAAAWLRVVAAGAVLVAALAAVVPRHEGGWSGTTLPPGAAEFETTRVWLQEEGARLDQVNADLVRRRREGLGPQELARLYEDQVVPGWNQAVSRLESMSPEARAIDPELVALVTLQRDSMRALVAALRTGEPGAVDRFNSLRNELEGRAKARRNAMGSDQPASEVSP